MKKLSFFLVSLSLIVLSFSFAKSDSPLDLTKEEIIQNDEIFLSTLEGTECADAMACPCHAIVYGFIDGLTENEVGRLQIKNYATGATQVKHLGYGSFSFHIDVAKGNLHGMKLCNKIPDINFPGNGTYAAISACGSSTWVVGDCHEHYFIPQYCN